MVGSGSYSFVLIAPGRFLSATLIDHSRRQSEVAFVERNFFSKNGLRRSSGLGFKVRFNGSASGYNLTHTADAVNVNFGASL